MPPTNKQQFVSCRDMGYAAAMVFKKPSSFKGLSIELAADELEWSQVAQAFSENQESMGLPPVKYKEVSPHLFWLISEDLWNIIMFYRNKGYEANMAQCKALFPGLTTFKEFLKNTKWGDPSCTYESLSEAELIKIK